MQVVPVERFGGLNLTDPLEVGWAGAADTYNAVSLDAGATIRNRPGLTQFYEHGSDILSMYADRYFVLIGTSAGVAAINPQAGSVATLAVDGGNLNTAASFGTDTDSYIYFWTLTGSGLRRLHTGAPAFSSPAFTGHTPDEPLVASYEGRLVNAGHSSTVWFSDPGDALTWPTSNFVQLDPGDGGVITSLVPYGNSLFAFKNTGRIYVFYGSSTDSAGNPVFNYRTVATNVNTLNVGYAACAAEDGVYFTASDGIYRTTGGMPVKISGAIDPIFGVRAAPASYTGPVYDDLASGASANSAVAAGDYVYFHQQTTSNEDYLLVYDRRNGSWWVWDGPVARGLGRVTGWVSEQRVILVGPTVRDLAYLDHTAATDDGSAIASHYTSGRLRLADGRQADVRDFDVYGDGTVTLSLAADGGAFNSTADGDGTVGGAVSTALATGLNPVNTGALCRDLSFKLSATSGAWNVDSLAARVQGARDWT